MDIVISKLSISWLPIMAEYWNNSITIDTEWQDDEYWNWQRITIWRWEEKPQRWQTGFESRSIYMISNTSWRRSGTHGIVLFHLILSFSTAVPNWHYRDSKTLNRIVVCIGLFISIYGDYKALACLVISCSQCGIFKLTS